MTKNERLIFWIILLGISVGSIFILRDVLLPFVAGMAIAYFLDPLVDRLEKLNWHRALCTAIVLIGFFVLAIGSLLLLAPVIQSQAINFLKALPGFFQKLEPLAKPILDQLVDEPHQDHLKHLNVIAGTSFKWLGTLFAQLLEGGVAIANLISLILITPIVSFYLLRDWDRIVAKINGWLPIGQRELIRTQCAAVDETLAAFVRGQGCVCIILGVFYAVCLSFSGLKFGILIGLFVGLVSFIPFVGAIIGGLLSVGLAALQFNDWEPIVIIAVIFIIGQLIESNFLTPRLVGKAIGLHPVWVIFSLLAGGALFGFVGVLLALPAAAVIGVLSRFALSQYLISPFHLHQNAELDDGGAKEQPNSNNTHDGTLS